jgi:hypothetical protein
MEENNNGRKENGIRSWTECFDSGTEKNGIGKFLSQRSNKRSGKRGGEGSSKGNDVETF